MRKQSNLGIIFTSIFLVVLILMLVFANWQLRKQNQRLIAVQETVVINSQSANALVNFINNSITQNQP
jgi:predicted metalloprotease